MQLFARKPIADLQPQDGPHSLKRVLGAGDLIMLAIGAVIGAGIFGAIGTAAAGQVGPDGAVIRYGAGPALVFSFLLLGGACALAALREPRPAAHARRCHHHGRRRCRMTAEPKRPQRVPTLTEVIIDLPPEQSSSAAANPPARGDAQVAPEALMAEALMQETRIVSKVIERLQPRIDVLFEHRLREALAPTVARVYAALADDVRKELARKIREAVEQAVNEEMGRHRGA